MAGIAHTALDIGHTSEIFHEKCSASHDSKR